MELINSNAGLLVLIGVVLNVLFFYFSYRQGLKQQQQNLKQFKASQQLIGYIGKKMVLEETPPEYADAHYRKLKKQTTKTPEEAHMDRLIERF